MSFGESKKGSTSLFIKREQAGGPSKYFCFLSLSSFFCVRCRLPRGSCTQAHSAKKREGLRGWMEESEIWGSPRWRGREREVDRNLVLCFESRRRPGRSKSDRPSRRSRRGISGNDRIRSGAVPLLYERRKGFHSRSKNAKNGAQAREGPRRRRELSTWVVD